MEGFETDKGYLGELSEATSGLERAELAHIRFRRCWHVVAVAEIAPAVIAGANARPAMAEERQKPVYFVAARDALLESKESRRDEDGRGVSDHPPGFLLVLQEVAVAIVWVHRQGITDRVFSSSDCWSEREKMHKDDIEQRKRAFGSS